VIYCESCTSGAWGSVIGSVNKLRVPDAHRVWSAHSVGGCGRDRFWLNGAAQESNLPSVGLRRRSGFEGVPSEVRLIQERRFGGAYARQDAAMCAYFGTRVSVGSLPLQIAALPSSVLRE
jgi:hypothetical protein